MRSTTVCDDEDGCALMLTFRSVSSGEGRDRTNSGGNGEFGDKEDKVAADKSRNVKSWLAVQGMRVNGDSVTLSEGIKVRPLLTLFAPTSLCMC